MIVVRYADDIVLGFEHRRDAERFLAAWQERLAMFGLDLHPDKTRLIEFGRDAADHRKARGEGKPDTFDFLGFHPYLREDPEDRSVHRQTPDNPAALLREARGDQGSASSSLARTGGDDGPVVESRRSRLLQLPRGARQHGSSEQLSGPGLLALVSRASASRSASSVDVGAVPAGRRCLDSECPHSASASERAFRRHASEVRAVCSNPARTDLCGGRRGNRRSYAKNALDVGYTGCPMQRTASFADLDPPSRPRRVSRAQ